MEGLWLIEGGSDGPAEGPAVVDAPVGRDVGRFVGTLVTIGSTVEGNVVGASVRLGSTGEAVGLTVAGDAVGASVRIGSRGEEAFAVGTGVAAAEGADVALSPSETPCAATRPAGAPIIRYAEANAANQPSPRLRPRRSSGRDRCILREVRISDV
mmetsp:Transcript_35666/g.106428  ORF Transcript_35666/g.106428 Transcript_35666/m.106428 type:complete len:155 (+) Transcript_35666:2411-2875(+)